MYSALEPPCISVAAEVGKVGVVVHILLRPILDTHSCKTAPAPKPYPLNLISFPITLMAGEMKQQLLYTMVAKLYYVFFSLSKCAL